MTSKEKPTHRLSEPQEPRIPSFLVIKDDEGEVMAVVRDGIGERDDDYEFERDCGD